MLSTTPPQPEIHTIPAGLFRQTTPAARTPQNTQPPSQLPWGLGVLWLLLVTAIVCFVFAFSVWVILNSDIRDSLSELLRGFGLWVLMPLVVLGVLWTLLRRVVVRQPRRFGWACLAAFMFLTLAAALWPMVVMAK